MILHFLLFRLPNAALTTNNLKQMAQGVLKGYDQATNLILDECHERVYSTKVGRVAIWMFFASVHPGWSVVNMMFHHGHMKLMTAGRG